MHEADPRIAHITEALLNINPTLKSSTKAIQESVCSLEDTIKKTSAEFQNMIKSSAKSTASHSHWMLICTILILIATCIQAWGSYRQVDSQNVANQLQIEANNLEREKWEYQKKHDQLITKKQNLAR